MDLDIKKAISEKIIKECSNDSKSYECLICDVKLSGESNANLHLNNSKHREAGGRYAIKNIKSCPKSILDILSTPVKEAVLAKEISVGKNSSDLLCNLCGSSNTGIISLHDHVVSSNHLKKRAEGSGATNAASTPKALNSNVKCVETKGVVIYNSATDLYCTICLKSCNGEAPMQEHLKSKAHIKKEKEAASISSIQNYPTPQLEACLGGQNNRSGQCEQTGKKSVLPMPLSKATSISSDVQLAIKDGIVDREKLCCNVCNDTKFTGLESLEEHIHSRKHREGGARKALANIRIAPQSLIEKLPISVTEAAFAEIVAIADSNKLKCILCQKQFSGILSLNDHLISADHRKHHRGVGSTSQASIPTVKNVTRQHLTDGKPLHEIPEIAGAIEEGIVVELDNKLEPFRCSLCDKKFNSSGTLIDHLKSEKHSKRVEKNPSPQKISTTVKDEANSAMQIWECPRYSVISDVRGHVYVFNNTKDRSGAEQDSINLKETFSSMGYKVFIHEDLSAEKTYEQLSTIQRQEDLNGIDSFIVFFLSHGVDDYTFLANDNEELDLRVIRREFTDRKCPYLKGKPKIFLANYCRGDQRQRKEIEYDTGYKEAPNDMVTIHAATEGIMAIRDRKKGTYFVSSLCEILKSDAKYHELRDIYYYLDVKMREKKATKPMWEDCGFKKFLFNPK